MRKGLPLLCMLMLMTASSFANKLENFRINADRGVKFKIVKLPNLKSSLASVGSKQNMHADRISLENNINNITGIINQELTIPSYTMIHIYNSSSQAHLYNIEMSVCVKYTDPQNVSCASAQEQVELKSAESINLQRRPEFSFNFNHNGTYEIFVETFVSRAEQETLFSSVATGEINIMDAQ